MTRPTLGVIGAGRVGTVLASRFRTAGYPVMGATGRTDASLLRINTFLPSVDVLTPAEVAAASDIVISVERAIEQAESGRGGQTGDVRWSTADEMRLLAIHGALHICGWDHAEPAEESAMRALEIRLLTQSR